MAQVSEELDRYLLDFERFETDGATRAASWVHELRTAAVARFAELGFPTTRDEEWKYTAVAPIAKVPFTRVGHEGPALLSWALGHLSFGVSEGARLVFVNGHYSREFSSLRALPGGVRVGSLAAALTADSEGIKPHLARYAGYEDHAFVAAHKAPAGLDHLTWGRFLWANLLPVTIGNVIGGALMVGAVYWFVYLRPRRPV